MHMPGFTPDTKIAIVYNQKVQPSEDLPEDAFAEYDDISVPSAIKAVLEKRGNPVDIVEANEDLYLKLRSGGYGFVFNMAEGIRGESRESHVPAILETLGIPYTGSGVLTQAVTLDKRRTKEILVNHGIPTPRYQVFHSWDDKISKRLTYPLFVKPNSEGSSKGIRNNSLVNNEEELREMLRFVIGNYRQPALVEEYLDGREFTVAILGNNPPRVMPIVEVTFDYLPPNVNKFDSYEVKWYWDSPNNPIDPIVCPAVIPKELERKIRNAALRSFEVLGCRDLCRIDMRLDSKGVPQVLDVNALPGLMPDPAENSRLPKSCFTAGMTYDDIINTIFDEALRRHNLVGEIKVSAGSHTAKIKNSQAVN